MEKIIVDFGKTYREFPAWNLTMVANEKYIFVETQVSDMGSGGIVGYTKTVVSPKTVITTDYDVFNIERKRTVERVKSLTIE
jgi:hypothetical protein